MKYKKEHINELIKIGKSLSIDDTQRVYFSKLDFLNRLSFHTWDSILIKLNDDELVGIFKGILLIEKELNWIGGSVASGVWIYKFIQKRKLDPEYNIANWALKNTNNPYIPFGSINHNSKNVVDYFLIKQEFSYIKKIEKISKEKRILENKITLLENKINNQENKITELKTRLKLISLTPNEIAGKIISDKKHPVYFYYHEIDKLIKDKSVDKKQLENILSKFKEKESKNIKELKNRLIKEITNR